MDASLPLLVVAFLLASLGVAKTTGFLLPPSGGNPPARTTSLFLSDDARVGVPVTPCTRICRYNKNVFDGQVCIGCFREVYEIGAWQSMNPGEKYFTLLDAMDRLEEATTSDSSIIEASSTGTSHQELARQADYWKALAESS